MQKPQGSCVTGVVRGERPSSPLDAAAPPHATTVSSPCADHTPPSTPGYPRGAHVFVCMQHDCTGAAVMHSSVCMLSALPPAEPPGLADLGWVPSGDQTWCGCALSVPRTGSTILVLCLPSSCLTSVQVAADSPQCFRGSFLKQGWPGSRHFLVP